MFRQIIRKIPGFRLEKDLRKIITSKEKYVIFMRIDQRLFIIYDKVRKIEDHYMFKFRGETLAVLDKHQPLYWKDYIGIGCNGSDFTNAPFMPDDIIKGDKLEKYNAKAIRWMQEHCRPIYNEEGDKIIGYDKTVIEFPGFDPMVVSHAERWSDNFNFAQELEDNRLYQFLHMMSMSTMERIKLFLMDMGILLFIVLAISIIAPDVIRIGSVQP